MALVLAAGTAHGSSSEPLPGPSCAFMLRELEQLLASRGAIRLASPGTPASNGSPGDRSCVLADGLRPALEGRPPDGVELCTVSSRALAVSRSGPEGSGRWWVVSVGASAAEGGVAGACLETSTVAWRNIPPALGRADGLPRWEVCPEDVPGRLEIWDSIPSYPDAEVTQLVLVRLVYGLQEQQLVVDLDATRRRSAELAAFYRRVARSSRNPLHARAAAMLEAFATKRACRK